MVDRTIVHQFNPERQAVGGIDTVIRDVITSSSPQDRWFIVGVQSAELGRRGLGRWRDADVAGRPVRFLPVAAINPDDQKRRLPHTVRLVGGLLRAGRPVLPGVVHVHRVDLAAALVRLYPRSEPVLWIHNTTEAALGRNSDSIWRRLKAVHGPVERLAIRRSRAVVTAGRPEFERVSALHGSCYELPPWYDDTIFRPRLDARDEASGNPLRLVWAARLETPKDPDLALDAVAELKQRGVQVHLDIFGTGTMEGGLRRRIEAESLGDVVTLRGPLPRVQLAAHLSDADVLLMTSHYEGSPRVLLEALGCGTPVVGPMAIDPAGVISTGNGHICEGRTVEAIADAVLLASKLDRAEVQASVADNATRMMVPGFLDRLEGRT